MCECDRYQQIIIDIFYGERKMEEHIKEHINQCNKCRNFYQDLNNISETLIKLTPDIPIEYAKINDAFNRAVNIKQNRSNLFSFIAFIVLSSLILSFVTVLAFMGYVKEIIYFQIGMYFVIPFLVPIFIKIRLVKEGYND